MSNLGKLFVFEGPDGVGKTSLALGLTQHFKALGLPCEYMAFPGKEVGTLGYLIYDLHHNPDTYKISRLTSSSLQLLHIAAHIDSIENRIRPALEAGHHVILDRYWWSTWVYGTVSGVHRDVLRGMIELELKSWKNLLPTNIFLIDRNSPLREDQPIDEWNKLRTEYRKLLADYPQPNYPIDLVLNTETLSSTLDQTIKIIGQADNETQLHDELQLEELQLELNLFRRFPIVEKTEIPTTIFHLSPAKPTEVYDTYWRFAAERQEIFFKKLSGYLPPWTQDSILERFKFTNAYRVLDRVSQFLIQNVIYKGDQSFNELFFRIILFKIFNKIETWKLLEQKLDQITYSQYSFKNYDAILTKESADGHAIFSSAYIMPSGSSTFGSPRKHRNYIKLLEKMMEDELPTRISESNSMKDVFELLRSYPLIGDFLAYQYTIDLNYSTLTNFSEMEFVVPGPGAKDGIQKCFSSLGGLNHADIIRLVTEHQDQEFERLGINFKSLFGRPLQLIDCQNLFCEVDKYARVAHPNIQGRSGRVRIKHTYRPKAEKMEYWFPPKWGLGTTKEEKKHDSNRGPNSK